MSDTELQRKAQERGVGFINLDRVTPDQRALRSVSRQLVTETRAFPVKRDGNTLWLAMADDRDLVSLDRYKLETGCRIVPVVAVPTAIDEWIERYYPPGG